MAPGPASLEPPGTPPTPAFVVGDNTHGEPSFQFTCDDYDGDQNQNNEPEPAPLRFPDSSHLFAASPRSSPATFLHPEYSTSLRPPTPEYAFPMASENGLANGGGTSPVKNPFNFQTQFISTAPVKSVCYLSLKSPCLLPKHPLIAYQCRTLGNGEAIATSTVR